MSKKKRVGILISGRGSNMAALVDAAKEQNYPAEIAVVISNRADAKGLDHARANGIATAVVDHKAHASRDAFDLALDRALSEHQVEFVACAGFMRIMTEGFVERWRDRMINIHPSLLPSYKGLHTHERALADGVKIHGCTVHFTRHDVDSGPIIMQAAVPVIAGDTPDSLAARVLKAEHIIYPKALRLVAAGNVRVKGETVISSVPEQDQKPFVVPSEG
ncbi:MAG: phosphoribosylglycinamide formyltransferase [Parvibaculaceae bacterium]